MTKKEVPATKVRKYENVLFTFYGGGEEPAEGRGTVIIREKEMVLDIDDAELATQYVIVGRAAAGAYAGRHALRGDETRVEARWTRLGDVYVGTWYEDGEDYLFSFTLPGRCLAR